MSEHPPETLLCLKFRPPKSAPAARTSPRAYLVLPGARSRTTLAQEPRYEITS